MGFDSIELGKTARMVVESIARIKPGEIVCLVADTKTLRYAEAIASASVAAGGETIVCIMTPRSADGEEPPPPIAAAMSSSHVVIGITTANLRRSQAYREISRAGIRTAMLYDMNEDVFTSPAVTPDYKIMHAETFRLTELLNQASLVRLATDKGTDLTFSIEGRKALCLSGLASERGSGGLPTGEAAIAPVENTAEGIVVVDHAARGIGKLLSPIKLFVEKGRIVSIEGKEEAMRLKEILKTSDENANNIAEFAIGTNPNSRMLGNVPEDKKKRGAVHLGIGNSTGIGGKVYSKLHLDMIILKPTVWLDGKEILTQGELRLF